MSKKIVFIGSAGSGKSTLAAEVFTNLKQHGLNAENIHEWIRFSIQAHGPLETIWDLTVN